MAFQLVYTSAAKLLTAGQSGFGTVARSKSITPLVVSAIERVSQFASMRGLDSRRIIHVHRRITAGSNRFHVLTRIVDAGADYSGRTNHLAHHLVISQEEAARAAARGITPADVLRQFPWLARWDGNARFFEAAEDIALESFRPDGLNTGRQSWASATGTAAHSRLLSWEGAPRTGVLIVPDAVDRLALLAEALVEFGPQSWSRSFTTSLETTDELSELEWIVTTPAAFAEIEPRCGSRPLLDLRSPASLQTPPAPVVVPIQPIVVAEPHRDKVKDCIVETAQRHQPMPRYGETQERPITASNPSPTFYTKRIPFFIAAAVLMLSVIIFWPTHSKSSSQNTTKLSDPAVTQKPPVESAAVKKMTDAGISKDDAEAIEKAAGVNTSKWAAFLTEFPNRIKDVKRLDDLKTLQASCEVPRNQQDMPAWVTKVATARKSIPTNIDNWPTETQLYDRLKTLGDIKRNFDDALSEKLPSLTKEDCENFDAALVSGQLKLFFEKNADLQSRNDQIHKSLTYEGGQFSVKIFPKRYKILSDYIKCHFVDFTSQDSLTALEATTYFHDNTYENFKLACKYWNDSSTKFDSPEIAKIPKSDFVPDNFAELLKDRRPPQTNAESSSIDDKSTIKAESPSSQSVVKNQTREIHLVSQEQLKNGFVVLTLEKLIKDGTLPPEFSIEINGKNKILAEIPNSDNQNDKYWFDDFNNATIKIHTDGRIEIPTEKIYEVHLKHESFDLIIAIDDSPITVTPLIPPTKFTLNKQDSKTATIGGELASWLSRIQPNSNLNFSALPINDFEIRVNKPNDESNSWCMKIAPNSKKYTTISEEKKNEVKSLWDKFKNSKKDNESLIESMKEATNKDRTKIEPKLTQNKEELKKIISEFKKILATQEIEKNILSEIENGHPNFEKIEITINKITGTQDKSESSINIDQMIEKIKNITVTSQNGRVLIEATK